MTELTTWLRLVHTRGLGPKLLRKLLNGFGSVDAIASASGGKLAEIGLSRRVIDAMSNVDPQLIEKDISWSREGDDRHILTLDSARYPALLKEIADPPIVLYVRGDPDVLQTPQLSIVGSRKPSAGAQANALRLAEELAAMGITITSGLALGVDGYAHRGALQANGFTVAVTATGLDRVYPASHQTLARDIAKSGAIISEFPVGTNPMAGNFPRRNRIISGLSYGTLVIEAALKSGTLITAGHATEQSREVFAIPGNIDNPQAKGSHALLKAGATMVETSADILQQLAPVLPKTFELTDEPARQKAPDVAPPVANSTQQQNSGNAAGQSDKILTALEFDALSLDELVEVTGLDVVSVTNLTLELELTGQINTVAGGRYQKVHAGK